MILSPNIIELALGFHGARGQSCSAGIGPLSQHFLLTSAARTLSLTAVARMSDEEAHARFVAIRWADNDGKPYCPKCGGVVVWPIPSRQMWQCKACNKQFSATSGTLFHSRKLAHRDYLAAIAIFVNAVKGISALQLGRDLDVSYRCAFVLAHKLREAMGTEVHAAEELGGEGREAAIDGAYFGGHVKPENRKADRKDRRLAEEQTGKRQVVVVAREHKGRAITWIVPSEGEAIPMIRRTIAPDTIVHADEGAAWDVLHASFVMKRVNHSIEFKAEDGACTNQAESFFSRLRRAEFGQHHRISGRFLYQYANEMAWRENHRREPNGTNWRLVVGAALAHPKSQVWCGYWNRSRA